MLLFWYLLLVLLWLPICAIVGFLTKLILRKKSDTSGFLYIMGLGFPASVISAFFSKSLWNRLDNLQFFKKHSSFSFVYLFSLLVTLIISLLINLIYNAIKKK